MKILRISFGAPRSNCDSKLWATLPCGIRTEILQHLDVRNYQRLTRVSKKWKEDIFLVPRYNGGAVFITWKGIRWPKNEPYGYARVEFYRAKIDVVLWSELLGCNFADVQHIFCEGGFFFSCFGILENSESQRQGVLLPNLYTVCDA